MKATHVDRWQCIACKRDHETSTAAERCCTTCRTCKGPQRTQTCARCSLARAVEQRGAEWEKWRTATLVAWALLVRVYPEAASILREEAVRRGILCEPARETIRGDYAYAVREAARRGLVSDEEATRRLRQAMRDDIAEGLAPG